MESKTRGDIVSEDENFPFCIEEKNRESWDHKTFIAGAGSCFSWFLQCARDAKSMDKLPLLFVTKNFFPHYVIFRPRDIKPLLSAQPKRYVRSHSRETGSLIMLKAEDFFELVVKEQL